MSSARTDCDRALDSPKKGHLNLRKSWVFKNWKCDWSPVSDVRKTSDRRVWSVLGSVSPVHCGVAISRGRLRSLTLVISPLMDQSARWVWVTHQRSCSSSFALQVKYTFPKPILTAKELLWTMMACDNGLFHNSTISFTRFVWNGFPQRWAERCFLPKNARMPIRFHLGCLATLRSNFTKVYSMPPENLDSVSTSGLPSLAEPGHACSENTPLSLQPNHPRTKHTKKFQHFCIKSRSALFIWVLLCV